MPRFAGTSLVAALEVLHPEKTLRLGYTEMNGHLARRDRGREGGRKTRNREARMN